MADVPVDTEWSDGATFAGVHLPWSLQLLRIWAAGGFINGLVVWRLVDAVSSGKPYLPWLQSFAVAIPIALFLGWPAMWLERRRAKRIEMRPEALRALTYDGRVVQWHWAEITEIREYGIRSWIGRTERFARLTDGSQYLYVSTDRFKDFDRVMAAIHARTPHARTDGPLDRIERYIMRAKPRPPTTLAAPTYDDSRR